jgi:hypothetical protein
MGFINNGSNVTQRVVFNSGTLDFGSNRIVDLDNIAVNIEWTTLGLYVLGSIKPQDLVRHTQKVTLTGKVKSFPPELSMYALGSSTPGTPQEIDTLDGQPTFVNPVVTLFDRNNKEIQYQLSGAIFKSNKLTAKMEDFAEWDFELEAKDIVEVYTA